MVAPNPASVKVVSINSDDGHTSELRVFSAKKDSSKDITPVLLCLPAMGIAAKKYDSVATAIVQQGIHITVGELRGIGSSSVRASRTSDFGYREIIDYDIPAMLKQVRNAFPNAPIYLMGHSLGGQMATVYLGQQPQSTKGLILCASCNVYYKGWAFPKNLGTWFATQAFAGIANILGYFPGKRIGFGGVEAKTVMRDWANNARIGKYQITGTDSDYDKALANVQLPVLAINFAEDGFAPLAATSNLLAKIPHSKITRLTLSAQDLNVKAANHFSWLRHPDTTAHSIAKWLKGHASS